VPISFRPTRLGLHHPGLSPGNLGIAFCLSGCFLQFDANFQKSVRLTSARFHIHPSNLLIVYLKLRILKKDIVFMPPTAGAGLPDC
jgi:hypothetical protein